MEAQACLQPEIVGGTKGWSRGISCQVAHSKGQGMQLPWLLSLHWKTGRKGGWRLLLFPQASPSFSLSSLGIMHLPEKSNFCTFLPQHRLLYFVAYIRPMMASSLPCQSIVPGIS